MKGFLRNAVPPACDILLLESGSQDIFRRALDGIRRSFPEARLHLITCWPDPPPGPFASLHRVRDYASRRDKLGLLNSFRAKPPNILGVVCSNESIMYSWKMLALLVVPAKTLIINENGDFFWFDWNNRRSLRSFLKARWNIGGWDFFYTGLRALVFPLTVLFLAANAAYLYARRWRRLLLWKIQGTSSRRGRRGQQGRTP